MIIKLVICATLAGGFFASIVHATPTPTATSLVSAGATIATTPREQWCIEKTQDVADCHAAYGEAP